VPLDDVSRDSRDVYMVVDPLDTLELIKISLDDKEPEDKLEGDLKEELEEEEPRRRTLRRT